MSDVEENVPVTTQEERGIADPAVVDKYKASATITNNALQYVMEQCVVGAKIVDVCIKGDEFITEATSKIYNKAKMGKGVAFPTSISVNEVCGHFSPLADCKDVLKENDVVKIDLGTQVDGYITVAAHTIVLSADKAATIKGPLADVVHATHTAMEAALRMLKPGNTNKQITDVIGKVASSYGVNPLLGVLSHELRRYVIDGDKVILSKETVEHQVNEHKVEVNDVYALDIVFSTGEGKQREVEDRAFIYKRSADTHYKLKMKASKYVMGELTKKFTVFPFAIRNMEDQTRAKLGIVECLNHGVVESYPVYVEREGVQLCHLKATVLVMPSQTLKVAGLSMDLDRFSTEHTVEDADIKAVLQRSLKSKSKKKKKKVAA